MRKADNILEYELGLESILRLRGFKYFEYLVYFVIRYHLSLNIFGFYHFILYFTLSKECPELRERTPVHKGRDGQYVVVMDLLSWHC